MRYCVVSPDMMDYYQHYSDPPEPPEPDICYVEIEASNKREARRLAVQHKDMKDWVEYARAGGCNPYAELEVVMLHDEEETE